MIHSLDNPPFAPDPTCPSCGTPWPEHLGLIGTCAELQDLRKRFTELSQICIEHIDTIIELKTRLAELEPPETPK